MTSTTPLTIQRVHLWATLCVTLSLAVSGCGVGPKMGPFEAHAPRGLLLDKTRFSAAVVPTLTIAASRQLTKRLDVGVAQEGIVSNAWLKYRVVDNPSGLAIAGTLGAFRGDSNFNATGAHAGAIVSYRFDPLTISLAARKHTTDYEPGSIDDDNNGHLGFPRLTTDSLEQYHSVDLVLTIRPRFNVSFHAGIRCADDKQTDFIEGIGYDVETGCLPIFAVSI